MVSAYLQECPEAGSETKTGKSSVLQEAQRAKLRSQVTWQSLLPQSLSLEEQPVHGGINSAPGSVNNQVCSGDLPQLQLPVPLNPVPN